MKKVTRFEKLVSEAFLSLPERIRRHVENVAIVVEKRPKRHSSLLGLYQGVPRNVWGRSSDILPDKITIYQEPLEKMASSPGELAEIVRHTVWHEVAHHFGFSEQEVRRLEAKWRKKKSL